MDKSNISKTRKPRAKQAKSSAKKLLGAADWVLDSMESDDPAALASLIQTHGGIDKPGRLGQTALCSAAYKEREDLILLLLGLGADIESRGGTQGRTALGCAAQAGWEEGILLLLGLGADPTATSISGNTALSDSADRGHTVAVERLLEAGSNIDAQDELGWTALMCAMWQNKPQTVAILVRAGARLDLANSLGQNVFEVAMDPPVGETCIDALRILNAEAERASLSLAAHPSAEPVPAKPPRI